MKTNHRRKNPSITDPRSRWELIDENGKPKYGLMTTLSLMRHGCGPNFSGRDGARKAVAGKKKKDHRAARHAADSTVRNEALSFQVE